MRFYVFGLPIKFSWNIFFSETSFMRKFNKDFKALKTWISCTKEFENMSVDSNRYVYILLILSISFTKSLCLISANSRSALQVYSQTFLKPPLLLILVPHLSTIYRVYQQFSYFLSLKLALLLMLSYYCIVFY
jgi:hypothetical protein